MGSITNSPPADGFRSLVLNLKPGKDIEHSHLWRGSSILGIVHKHRYRATLGSIAVFVDNLKCKKINSQNGNSKKGRRKGEEKISVSILVLY